VSQNAILFDLDDTLYPERAYVLSGFRAVAEYLGNTWGIDILSVYLQLTLDFERGIRGHSFNLVLSHFGFPESECLVRRLVEIYRTHTPRIALYSDAARVLSLLRTHLLFGLLTDGYADVQRRKVHALGIEPFFDTIVYSDDFGRQHWKPSILPFKHLLRRLDIKPDQAVYVGDNPRKDFIGARKIGMTTIQIKRAGTEHGEAQPEPGFEADYILTTLDDLPLLTHKVFPLSPTGL
jgi:putative hydrolase of the HAD superfamily